MCRLLAYVGPPGGRRRRSWSSRRTRCWRQCTGARAADQRLREPRRLGHRLVRRRRRPATRALPHAPRRCRPTTPPAVARLAHVAVRPRSWPTSGTSRRARPPRWPATRRSSTGRWLFAHNGFVEGYRDGATRAASGRAQPGDGRVARPATPTARCCSAWCSIRLDRRRRAGRSAVRADGASTAGSATGGKYNLVLTDGDAAAWPRRWGNSLLPAPRSPAPGAVIVASEPYDDEPGLAGPSPTGRWCVVDGTGADRRSRSATPLEPTTRGGPAMTDPTPTRDRATSASTCSWARPTSRTRCAPTCGRGLTATPKELPPKWFYDDRGCELFDAITRLPEYYPTERERTILRAEAAAIADVSRRRHAGRARLGHLRQDPRAARRPAGAGQLRRFVPFEISETTLRAAADAIAAEYPGVDRARRGGRLRAPPRRPPAWRHAAWSPSWAGPSATSRRPSASGSSPTWPTACAPATASCSAPIWSRTSAGSRPPTTTRRA